MRSSVASGSSLPALRLLLSDDHTLLRIGLRRILEEQPEWRVVAEAGDGRQAVQQALALRPDVAILDIGMPLLNGIEATRQIVRRAPDVRVLILSMHAQEAYVVRAVQAGAAGYLLKDSAGKDLIDAVAAVGAGQSFFSPAIGTLLLDDYVRCLNHVAGDEPYDTLSEREREVLQLLAEGRSNKVVADMLSISVATVETHRARIFEKLDVHNTAGLVLYAIRQGVIT